MARNHSPMASSRQRRKQAIRHQKEPRTRQIPKRRKGSKATMEGGPEGKTEGQLRPYGGGRGSDPTTPHRTPGKFEEGRTMLPLRGPGPHVKGMPQKA